MNQRLRIHMEQAFPEGRYLYHESDGGHDWFFWNEQLKEMARIFGFI